MSVKITESEVSKSILGKDILLEKKLYIECMCGSLDHVARVNFCRELVPDTQDKTEYMQVNDMIMDKDGAVKYQIVEDMISFEFNLTNRIEPSFTKTFKNKWDRFFFPLERFCNRVKGAVKLVLGRPVWFSTELLLDKESTEELANMLKKSLTDIDNVKI